MAYDIAAFKLRSDSVRLNFSHVKQQQQLHGATPAAVATASLLEAKLRASCASQMKQASEKGTECALAPRVRKRQKTAARRPEKGDKPSLTPGGCHPRYIPKRGQVIKRIIKSLVRLAVASSSEREERPAVGHLRGKTAKEEKQIAL
ncbi:hypothetical protein Cni_G15355 [Canna indica]|uniref:Uncharacterized protein n=1 Tax=Canna indica TaxID=4628 RepID=A0AAQ3QBH3_9LILI|nr:hypothetical protein Cni_G15355 [Canna indica]